MLLAFVALLAAASPSPTPSPTPTPLAIPSGTPRGMVVGSPPSFSFTAPDVVKRNGLILTFYYSHVEFVLTDPSGRKTGFDVATGEHLNEIPGAGYDRRPATIDYEAGIVDDDPPTRITMAGPDVGEYVVDGTGVGGGTYSFEIASWDDTGKHVASVPTVEDQPLATGDRFRYTIVYDSKPGAVPQRLGGFDGGGQLPRDANRFLTYVMPTSGNTKLPAGTTEARIAINYGATVKPQTFAATLNGVDVTASFHPAPDAQEAVKLPVSPGSNVLKLSIDGLAGRRTAIDSDRLVFDVQ